MGKFQMMVYFDSKDYKPSTTDFLKPICFEDWYYIGNLFQSCKVYKVYKIRGQKCIF